MNKNQILRLISIFAFFISISFAFMYLAWQARYEDPLGGLVDCFIASISLMSSLVFADDYTCEISGNKLMVNAARRTLIIASVFFLTLTMLTVHWTDMLWENHPFWSVLVGICGIPSALGATAVCLLCYFLEGAELEEGEYYD